MGRTKKTKEVVFLIMMYITKYIKYQNSTLNCEKLNVELIKTRGITP